MYPPGVRERGQRVHAHTAALDHGQTPARAARTAPLVDGEDGYCRSWDIWKALYHPQFVLIEHPLFDPIRRVAGAPDRVAVLRRPGFPIHIGNINLKTGDLEPWHALQLSIYDLLIQAWIASGQALGVLQQLRIINYGVYLRVDGGEPKTRTFDCDPRVHALLTTAQLRRSYR